MTTVSVACPAKVNLFLRILAREESGHHQIETFFLAIGLYDRVEVRNGAEGIGFEVRQKNVPGLDEPPEDLGAPEDNTVVRSARAFFRATGIEAAVSIVLTKSIPAGTGLGGGSSDAAGALMALNAMYGEPLRAEELIRLGGCIGADVPFFCTGAPAALAWGRGDRLLTCRPPPAAQVVVAIPRERVRTGAAYREASRKLKLPVPSFQFLGPESGEWMTLAPLQENDFEGVIFRRIPLLAKARAALAEAGAVVARLTGSGSAVFGVFPTGRGGDVERGAARLRAMAGVSAVLVVPTLTAMPARVVVGAQPRRSTGQTCACPPCTGA